MTSATTNIAEFIQKTFNLINQCSNDDSATCTWNEEGDSFIIKNVDKFTDKLPHYFRHKNFRSFVRQLNFYGFRKIKAESTMYPSRPVEW
jgi:hypothetical protein